ncbi:hypothetical protein BKA61DRAFT_588438 [Leptodontidium sp. MPI-SDFR-AT-0119]|nr:hypothetical protein BKA61DRAFT_588438 [Leptodontidium sp. MPI-SDFR-AT-0119]
MKYPVPFVVKTSSNWTNHAKPFNLRLVYQPAVITIPETPEQVSSSVICAAAASLKVQAKGGGHSYASHSSGGQDGSLIVDIEKFAAVKVNQTTFVAKIGAGQRLSNFATKIYEQGKRRLPHRMCSRVSIVSHALHGRYGHASRKWGITIDTIVGLDVILANGTQVHTTAESYPDLFYAMKGAGESYGIVIYFYLQTQLAPSSVLFSAGLAASLKNLDAVTSGFEKLQNLSLTSTLITPNIAFGMYTDSGGIFSLSGWCLDCDAVVFSKTVLPAMLAGFPGSIPTVRTQGWIEALANLAAPHTMEQPLGHEYAIHDTFYAKSLVSKNAHPLSTASIRAFWSYIIANQGKGPFYGIIDLYGGPGSVINSLASESSA